MPDKLVGVGEDLGGYDEEEELNDESGAVSVSLSSSLPRYNRDIDLPTWLIEGHIGNYLCISATASYPTVYLSHKRPPRTMFPS